MRKSSIGARASNKESEPIYHISWTEDYFLLGNLITTVRRGGTAEGQLVAEYKYVLAFLYECIVALNSCIVSRIIRKVHLCRWDPGTSDGSETS